MSTDAQVPFLTQEAYDRLVAELEHLSTHGRDEIAKRIEAARQAEQRALSESAATDDEILQGFKQRMTDELLGESALEQSRAAQLTCLPRRQEARQTTCVGDQAGSRSTD